MPTTSRSLPRPSPSLRGHPNKAVHGGGGDERVPQGVRFARALAGSSATSLNELRFAEFQDAHDKLSHLRYEYHIPQRNVVWPEAYRRKLDDLMQTGKREDEDESVYLAGNSLGCMPKGTPDRIAEELTVWRNKYVGYLISCEGPVLIHSSAGPSSRMWSIRTATPGSRSTRW